MATGSRSTGSAHLTVMTDRPFRDSAALEHLVDAMEASGRHDLSLTLSLLDDAEATLGTRLGKPGFHQARAPIHTARSAARDGRWTEVWAMCWQAICSLTWAFPPDPSTLPPQPTDRPFAPGEGCACGEALPKAARFCPACGTPRPTQA